MSQHNRRSSHRAAWIRGVALSALCICTSASAEWSHLQALHDQRGADVTAIAVDLDTGKTLQALNPDQRLTPASLTKIVLASAALGTWDVDKTFSTRALATGPLEHGQLYGDLVVYSEGDATFDHQSLWYLAAQIKQAGVQKINGGLVINASAFGPLNCETKDRCDALARSHTAYDAPLAAFGVDYGTWCVDVLPLKAEAPAQVRSCAAVDVPIPLEGEIQARGKGRSKGMWLDRVTLGGNEALAMGGDLPLGSDRRFYRSMSDPALGAGMLLRQVLGELGISVDGAVSVSYDAMPANTYTLGSTESLPLREQIGRLLRYSNNYISDVLTVAMAAERTPEPVSSLANASRSLVDLVMRARTEVGYGGDAPPVLLSGSGLTPENKLSAKDLVAVLHHQYHDSRKFPAFYAGLVVPGEAPHKFIRNGSEAWQDRVALKTGTLSEPRSVFGTAGYLRKRDGGWIAFAALANGAPRKAVPMSNTLAAIRDDIDALLARY